MKKSRRPFLNHIQEQDLPIPFKMNLIKEVLSLKPHFKFEELCSKNLTELLALITK